MKGKFVASARHLGRSIWKNRACYSLMLPGIIWFILFAYGPMSGCLHSKHIAHAVEFGAALGAGLKTLLMYLKMRLFSVQSGQP